LDSPTQARMVLSSMLFVRARLSRTQTRSGPTERRLSRHRTTSVTDSSSFKPILAIRCPISRSHRCARSYTLGSVLVRPSHLPHLFVQLTIVRIYEASAFRYRSILSTTFHRELLTFAINQIAEFLISDVPAVISDNYRRT